MRDIWRKLDGAAGAPNLYSLQGVKAILKQKDLSLATTLSEYAAANRHPRQTYSEGLVNQYPTAGPARTYAMRPGGVVKPTRTRLDHLTSTTIRFVPERTGDQTRLRLRLDMAPTRHGSAAVVAVTETSGETSTRLVRLDGTGAAKQSVPFAASTVARVELILVNASGRFRCERYTTYSCHGTPKDDKVAEIYRAAVVS